MSDEVEEGNDSCILVSLCQGIMRLSTVYDGMPRGMFISLKPHAKHDYGKDVCRLYLKAAGLESSDFLLVLVWLASH